MRLRYSFRSLVLRLRPVLSSRSAGLRNSRPPLTAGPGAQTVLGLRRPRTAAFDLTRVSPQTPAMSARGKLRPMSQLAGLMCYFTTISLASKIGETPEGDAALKGTLAEPSASGVPVPGRSTKQAAYCLSPGIGDSQSPDVGLG